LLSAYRMENKIFVSMQKKFLVVNNSNEDDIMDIENLIKEKK